MSTDEVPMANLDGLPMAEVLDYGRKAWTEMNALSPRLAAAIAEAHRRGLQDEILTEAARALLRGAVFLAETAPILWPESTPPQRAGPPGGG